MTGFARPPALLGRQRECAALDGLMDTVRGGRGGVLVMHGEAGIGKTALLDHVAGTASDVRMVRVAGVESEMELAFAALHQLCAPLLDHLPALPGPQHDALATAFGRHAGPTPDHFLVGLAVLSLLSEAAGERPLVCLVDDGQWLDHASGRALAFAARRLLAEPVLLVIATREPGADLAGLPDLPVHGVPDAQARDLLASVLRWPLDERIRERILAEARGNPLALLELPRGRSQVDLAGGFAVPDPQPLSRRIEESFGRQIACLPADTRRLLLLAAADPVGDPALVWAAARRLGLPAEAAVAAEEAGLIEFTTRVRFRHPLVRSAAYRSGSLHQRLGAHQALAESTDPAVDPDRHAWHRAQATPGPDDDVAVELAHAAGRVQARGGLAAAAAFLDRAALLTPDPAQRAWRLLDAARARRDAGDLDAALEMVTAAEAGPPDEARSAQAQHLRGQITFEQRRAGEAVGLLFDAARSLEPVDAKLARQTYLEALGAAIWTADLDRPGTVREIAAAARAAAPGPTPPRAVDVLLDALATRLTDGYTAAAPMLDAALRSVLALEPGTDVGEWLWLAGFRAAGIVAGELWDYDTWHTLAARQANVARDAGALVHLQFAVNFLARTHLDAGELVAAAQLLDEDRLIAETIGTAPVGYTDMALAAWRGREAEATELIQSTVRDATAHGQGRLITFADHAAAVLNNGLGRHDEARVTAQRAFDDDLPGYGPFIVPELAEAHARAGDRDALAVVLRWLSERTRATPGDWVLGTEACVRALSTDGTAADDHYREALDRLGRTRLRAPLARTHLLYGEWLRRENRRVDARQHLRLAHEMLTAMGIEAFAERARRELQATGETVRKRNVATVTELTAQEAQIARMVRAGLSNPEISTQLYLSPRTVEWHLHKVFNKLEIRSRRQLRGTLPLAARRALSV
ncbi:helix-turn-helix transcriptional regulator [Virgisporangium aurantiacum]|uniref:LuxR family transcriptional regulator n=1 Tax=Virgisporangium aurantiacum TaxID=175570 RepID=A0A8J3YZ45_9ACTN|nr:LuxR family transcriptional regulator [Virgisporangium aurantiacum]GIJ54391.1 LuxR family transcriptional regulator [Virgisporangium aurantiacum]